jgi:acyl transferase domain-containing protein
MVTSRTAILFSGQGNLRKSTLTDGDMHGCVLQVLEEMGTAAGVWGHGALEKRAEAGQVLIDHSSDKPENLALLVFAASVAQYRSLENQGLRPMAMVGHGFGEIIALVCAGAFSVQHGAEIVLNRTAVLEEKRSEAGAMVAVKADKSMADTLVELAGAHRAVVAAENSPLEVVISGRRKGIERVRHLARNFGIAVIALKAPWALHYPPIMLPVAGELKTRLRHIPSQPLRIPVFSPILARYYTDSDNLTESLADHLTRPVRFSHAVRYLSSCGVESFIECGPLSGLGRCVRELGYDSHSGIAPAESESSLWGRLASRWTKPDEPSLRYGAGVLASLS